MCIRDRSKLDGDARGGAALSIAHVTGRPILFSSIGEGVKDFEVCLLYTSDAADERSSVDLGGRRIIKKKKN